MRRLIENIDEGKNFTAALLTATLLLLVKNREEKRNLAILSLATIVTIKLSRATDTQFEAPSQEILFLRLVTFSSPLVYYLYIQIQEKLERELRIPHTPTPLYPAMITMLNAAMGSYLAALSFGYAVKSEELNAMLGWMLTGVCGLGFAAHSLVNGHYNFIRDFQAQRVAAENGNALELRRAL